MVDFETACVKYEDSAMGKLQNSLASQHTERMDELQKLRDDFDKYVANQAADKISDEERHIRERRSDRVFAIFAGALSGLLASSLAGLFIYYWPSIVSFFTKLLQ